MANLVNIVRQLGKERTQAQRRIEQIDAALNALSGVGSSRGGARRAERSNTPGRKRRTMSAAARKKIAAAQRARWAKWKAGKQNR